LEDKIPIDLLHTTTPEDTAEFVPVPLESLGDQVESATDCQTIETLLDEVPGSGKIHMVGWIGQDKVEVVSGYAGQTITEGNFNAVNAIELTVPSGQLDCAGMVIHHDDVAWADDFRSQHADHAVPAAEIENLLSLLKIHHGQHGQRTEIDFTRRKLIFCGLEDQFESLDIGVNHGKVSTALVLLLLVLRLQLR
jgi:hypothetical protein